MPSDVETERDTTRLWLGIAAAALLAGGGLALIPNNLALAGVLLRSGAVLGAVWLVYPSARHIPGRVLLAGAGIIVLALVRPRIGIPLAILGLTAYIISRKAKKPPGK